MGLWEDMMMQASQQQQPQITIQDLLDEMRAEGQRYPNYGEAFERLERKNRKYVESRVIENITGEHNG